MIANQVTIVKKNNKFSSLKYQYTSPYDHISHFFIKQFNVYFKTPINFKIMYTYNVKMLWVSNR